MPPPKRAPASGREVVLHRFGRLALVLTGLTGGVALVAWLVARRSDEPLSHALPTAYYLAGCRVRLPPRW